MMFNGIYRNKTVLVTGHTGFKGSWFCLFLEKLGANVIGYSLPPPTQPNHFDLLQLSGESIKGDVRDYGFFLRVLEKWHPNIVFHFAAQSLVRYSYRHPVETYETNVMGTANVLEACRHEKSIKSIIIVSSDKCYENNEWVRGYRENDRLGGLDPYSCSKGCVELITNSYRRAYFASDNHRKLLASVRAGNVIGGGDWAENRIVPDIVKAASEGKPAVIRNPDAVRPWQHVLDPLAGYLQLGQKLLEGESEFSGAWNFGPALEIRLRVRDLAEIFKSNWDAIDYHFGQLESDMHETGILSLDSSKAKRLLEWKPVWKAKTPIKKTVDWYKNFYCRDSVLSNEQLNEYIKDAKAACLPWTTH
jgi:CDP-glucose 4,6-dehydratase